MRMTYADAIRVATHQAMEKDDGVLVMGQGLATTGAHLGGGLWGTVPLDDIGRLIETPLSEEAMTGVALGLAQAGKRPILTHIRADFLHLTTNQIVNMAAKRSAWGNQMRHGMVVRAVIGRSWGQGAQHSQAPMAQFVNVPGLNVMAPVTPQQAYECMRVALTLDDPTIIFEHRLLHKTEGDVFPHNSSGFATVRGDRFLRYSRDPDVTLVGISHAAVECHFAALMLEENGIAADVVTAVDLAPLDMECILASAKKSKNVLIVDNGWLPCGIGAEIAARLHRHAETIERLGWKHVTCPPTRAGEKEFYPSAAVIAATACKQTTGADEEFPEQDTFEFKGPF